MFVLESERLEEAQLNHTAFGPVNPMCWGSEDWKCQFRALRLTGFAHGR